MLFLTLDGKPSKTHEGRIPYLRISYATHILAWLETCLRETYQIPPINQVLQQYRAVVRKLTGKNIESSAMKNISDFIRQHPDIIHFRKQIDEEINEACASYLDDLADGIIKELQKHNEFSVRLAHELRFGTDLLGSLIITLPPNSILRSVPCEICVENDKEWNTLCVGITIESVKALVLPEHEVLFRKMQELLALDANRIGYYNPKITNHWPTGWLHLIEGTYDDERLAELIRKPLSETVSNVCGNVRSYIALLEAVCTKATQATSTPPRTTTLIAEEKTLPPSSSA